MAKADSLLSGLTDCGIIRRSKVGYERVQEIENPELA